MRGSIVLALTTSATLSLVVACSASFAPCYRGEYRGCTCELAPGASVAAHGYQACTATEDGFGACVCDGTTPGLDGGTDAGGTDAGDGGDGAPYLAACSASGTCSGADAICVTFGNKGKTCTKRCAGPSDCPPPSLGCSPNMGVCRPP